MNIEIDTFTNMAKPAISKEYKAFLEEIKRKVYEAQYQAIRKVNKELIGLYWYIGQTIVTRQSRFKWGKAKAMSDFF